MTSSYRLRRTEKGENEEPKPRIFAGDVNRELDTTMILERSVLISCTLPSVRFAFRCQPASDCYVETCLSTLIKPLEKDSTLTPRMIKCLLRRLIRSCDCSDALAKLKHRNGGCLADLVMYSPRRQEGDTKIIGPAYTVEYALIDDPRPKVTTHYVCSTRFVPC